MRITHDVWLSDITGGAVYRVDADGEGGVNEVVAHAREQRSALYFAKVASDRVQTVLTLARAGFVVVDVNVTFQMAAPSTPRQPLVEVRQCTASAADAVLDIAGSCFRYTRFHLDPLIDVGVAHRIKREWIRSYVMKQRGDRLFVAYVDGKPAGFLASLVADHAGEHTAIIDLVGVEKALQGRGVGQSLVNAFVEHYRRSCASLVVGTQVANVPSVRLYEKLGFSLVRSEYVLHHHAGEPSR